MTDIYLVGGMGVGKDTLINELIKHPDVNHIYMGSPLAGIPLQLSKTTLPNLLTLSREECIAEILDNQEITIVTYPRDEFDTMGGSLMRKHGPDFPIHLYLALRDPDKSNIYNHVVKVSNLKLLVEKHNGLALGLYCSNETQAQRRFASKKPMNPKTFDEMLVQVRKTNDYFEEDEMLGHCDLKINTDQVRTDDPAVVQQVLQYL
jgi:hypothetical protein